MMTSFDLAAILFVIAALIGVVNERLFHLPRPIALLLGALAVSILIVASSSFAPELDLAGRTQLRLRHADLQAVLLDGVLALLLFAASLHVDLGELRKRGRSILVLATVGVVIAMVLFGGGIWLVLGMAGIAVPLAWCLVLGAILAPTDAVAVEQLLHRVQLPQSLKTLISGESLFNDGAAVVLFFAALAGASGQADVVGHGKLLSKLVIGGVGGAVLGLALGWLAGFVTRRIRDQHIIITISLALVFTTYRAAYWLDLSGPISVVVCGLAFRSFALRSDSAAHWHEALNNFWSMLDDLVNTMLFLLMGFEILAIPFKAAGLVPILAAIPLALFARMVSVALPILLQKGPLGHRLPVIGVLTWTGLRGGISLALVLALPDGPYRDILAAICYAVVIFTVVVQGLSTPRVVTALFPPAHRPPA